MKLIIYFLTVLSGLLFISCKENEPSAPDTSKRLGISVSEVTCTDAILTVKTENISLPYKLSLSVNEETQEFNCFTSDTLILLDSLAARKLHTVKAVANSAISANLDFTTLDTTNHNFSVRTYKLGETEFNQYNRINDVAVLYAQDIWVAGQIYQKDSLGNRDDQCYNAAHWNGIEWELKRILYKGWSYPLNTILAFGSNDIWFSATVHYNDSTFTEYQLPNNLIGFKVNRMWGINSENLYAVGDSGMIAHFDGNAWQRIESGTKMRLIDINGNTNSSKIWICAQDEFTNNSMLLMLTNNSVQTIYEGGMIDNKLVGRFTSVWGSKDDFVYVSTNWHLLKVEMKTDQQPRATFINAPGGQSISGTGPNDIFICQEGGKSVVHFNGASCKDISLPHYSIFTLRKVRVKDNTIVVVDCNEYYDYQGQGFVHIIKRY